MPTWQISPDAGNTYRWVISGDNPSNEAENPSYRTPTNRENSTTRLSSMEDLLVQGSSKLLQKNDNSSKIVNNQVPMFRTGAGKLVGVKRSSFMKALSVLGDECDAIDTGQVHAYEDGSAFSNSLLKTASGNMVNISSAGVTEAKSLLGLDENSIKFNTNDGYGRGSSLHPETRGETRGNICSNRGLDSRPVLTDIIDCQTSKQELREGIFLNHVGSVIGDRNALDTGQVHLKEDGCSFSSSLFKTGSGEVVNLSSVGVTKAKSLLGLDEKPNKFPTDDSYCWENQLRDKENVHHKLNSESIPGDPINCQTDMYMSGWESKEEVLPNLVGSNTCTSTSKPPPMTFQTGGGRYLSVSNEALQRAMNLLDDSEVGGGTDGSLFSFIKENSFNGTLSNKEHDLPKRKFISKGSLPPKGSYLKEKHGSLASGAFTSGGNFLKQNDANNSALEGPRRSDCSVFPVMTSSCQNFFATCADVENHSDKGIGSRTIPSVRSSGGPLVDISNNVGRSCQNQKQAICEKRSLVRRSYKSPFKSPRNSGLSTPNRNNSYHSNDSGRKAKFCSRYPFQVARVTVKDYFGGPPYCQNQLEHVPDVVKCMNATTAATYVFPKPSCLDGIGVEAFRHMLDSSGASMQYVSMEWVTNHFKWIVWKLACYERGFPAEASGKYLTVCNVLEELKYRYEREVNHGHRSALKRILEGDASPASMLVLCVSAIRSNPNGWLKLECAMAQNEDSQDTNKFDSSSLSETTSNVGRIELTDGWYSMDAVLDQQLTKQLVAGKLFVGQKLRIWRAGLRGWDGPISPLESSKTVNLLLHINGTYRAHWADRLGICRGHAAPLAFSCIKSTGGLIPRTLVGVTRIYPILYRERLMDGGFIARSEKMESKALELYNQRRRTIAEDVMSEFNKEVSRSHCMNENDCEEGAEILKMLEKAAEPENLMAGMSVEQLTSFATYKAKQEAIKQSDMERKIVKALEEAGLSKRKVTPYMKVKVVGLTYKHTRAKGQHRNGLITIWNPTENQQFELVEGQAYMIDRLIPSYSDSETIYLQAGGSTTWKPLSSLATANLEPFFTPRRSVSISKISDVPLTSEGREFDIAAVVVYVGEVHLCGHEKQQWVFVTDGSISGSELESGGSSDCLLAISFCSPIVDNDTSAPVNHTLTGSTVGFLNLIKHDADDTNHLWIAQATDKSTYTFCYDLPGCRHLKEAAESARKWAEISSLAIQKLRKRAEHLVGIDNRC